MNSTFGIILASSDFLFVKIVGWFSGLDMTEVPEGIRALLLAGCHLNVKFESFLFFTFDVEVK